MLNYCFSVSFISLIAACIAVSFAQDKDGAGACSCREPCLTTQFETVVSDFKFPSESFIRQRGLTGEKCIYFKATYI